MRQLICLSLCAGLLISSAAVAADISTWRWHVSQALRAQQDRDAAKVYREACAEVTLGTGMSRASVPQTACENE